MKAKHLKRMYIKRCKILRSSLQVKRISETCGIKRPSVTDIFPRPLTLTIRMFWEETPPIGFFNPSYILFPSGWWNRSGLLVSRHTFSQSIYNCNRGSGKKLPHRKFLMHVWMLSIRYIHQILINRYVIYIRITIMLTTRTIPIDLFFNWSTEIIQYASNFKLGRYAYNMHASENTKIRKRYTRCRNRWKFNMYDCYERKVI